MNIIALDLGTTTGICEGREAPVAYSKSWATAAEVKDWHKSRMDRRQDPRVLRFAKYLRSIAPCSPDRAVIVFEDVQFQSYTLQTQLWSSFRAAVWITFEDFLVECVPTGTLKKFATGHGGATKEMMSNALKRQYPQHWNPLLDDNAVDALWLWLWADRNLTRNPNLTKR
jgi:hypothetical protein